MALVATAALIGQVSAGALPGTRSTGTFVASCGALAAAIGLAFVLPRAQPGPLIRLLVPSGYLVSLGLLFASHGASATSLEPLVLLPILWAARYHTPAEATALTVGAVCVLVVTGSLADDPVELVVRTAGLWALSGAIVVLGARQLRIRLDDAIAEREEALRQAGVLGGVARELNSTLEPQRVVAIAVRLAAEIASPPGLRSRRANYCRISDGVVRVDAEFDDEGRWHGATWPLAEHPLLAESVRTRVATVGRLDRARLGPVVRHLADAQGVRHGAWVPVVVDGELHGVLAVAGRNRPISDQDLSRCVAIVGIMELALTNALAHERSQHAALTDPLTSLANRRGLERLVDERRARRPLAVLAIDLDGLKAVNDRLGHAAGDELLMLVAEAIRSVVRTGDVVARVGGDEFVCVALDADTEAAVRGATRILDAVGAAEHRGEMPRISIGIATDEPDESLEHVLRRADAAMYEAKRAGGMRFALAGAEADPTCAGGDAEAAAVA